MEKQAITVSASLEKVEQAKELLLEIEALSEKYEVNASVTISPQVNLEESYRPT
ncbi:MAG: hypothetical protein ACRCTN_11040 [Carnobacterium maltaromaticum]